MSFQLGKALARVKAAIDILKRGAVTDAIFFDDAAYRASNQDVAQSVEAGNVRNFYDHYARYGKWEGRRFFVRSWGLEDARAARVFLAAARLEAKWDLALCMASYGELAHRLVGATGERLVKPIGPWKHQLDRGPWRVRLPASAAQGGWYMLKARVAPVRAPMAFVFLGRDRETLGKAGAMFCRPVGATQRMLRLPAGASELQLELLDQRLRTQPLRVRLRRVPDSLVERRMLRRLLHHHPSHLGRGAEEVTADLRRRATAEARALREVMWEQYQDTFPAPVPQAGYTEWVDVVERPLLRDLDQDSGARVERLVQRPLISVLMPVHETNEHHLSRALSSVLEQSYPHWELCIVDDASRSSRVRNILEEHARQHPRVKLSFRSNHGHICHTCNDALALASGELVAVLDHDDVLPRHALLLVAQAATAHPRAALFYGDEDKLSGDIIREQPHFKPAFDPDLLLGQNYLGHLVVARTDRVREVGGFRPGYEGSQDHDLWLRLTERLTRDQIVHIPQILYHWRMSASSTAASAEAKPYTAEAGIKAVRDALMRRDVDATVEHGEVANTYRVTRQLPTPAPLVTVIIPTRDAPRLLATCVDSLLGRTDYPAFEVLIVDNHTTDPEALRYLERAARDDRVMVLRDDRPFNFSALNNRAVTHAKGSIITLLNNDIEVIDAGWLRELVSHAVRPEIGCVGAKLLYPDGTIQHAGVVVGLHGLAGHPYKHMSAHHPGYYGRLGMPHSVSAVTAACLAVDRAKYQQLGGFDERIAVAFNDVDFCLRASDAGYRNLLAPRAVLRHHESATRGLDQDVAKRQRFMGEVELLKQRWGSRLYADPCYSPHLSLDHDDYSLRITGQSTRAAGTTDGAGR
jgi:GT2 family glycosyltransferase